MTEEPIRYCRKCDAKPRLEFVIAVSSYDDPLATRDLLVCRKCGARYVWAGDLGEPKEYVD
jgi:hypothetical protein